MEEYLRIRYEMFISVVFFLFSVVCCCCCCCFCSVLPFLSQFCFFSLFLFPFLFLILFFSPFCLFQILFLFYWTLNRHTAWRLFLFFRLLFFTKENLLGINCCVIFVLAGLEILQREENWMSFGKPKSEKW